LLRGKVKEEIVKLSGKYSKEELLEAKFVSLANSHFHKISDEITQEVGIPQSEKVFPKWVKKMDEEIKKFQG
jgi:hypothetical protein